MENNIIPLHRSPSMSHVSEHYEAINARLLARRKKQEEYIAACREKYGEKPRQQAQIERPTAIVSAPARYQNWTCPQCKIEIDSDEKYGFLKKPDGSPIPCPLCSPKPLAAKNRRISDKLIADLVQQRKLSGMDNLPANASRLTFDSYPGRGDKQAKKEVQLFVKGAVRSLFLVGLAGRGKTGLAIAAANALTDQGKQVLFLTFEKYVELIREEFDAKAGEQNQIKRIMELVDYLIIDDFAAGSSTAFTLKEAQILVDSRENAGLKTLITCNYDYDDLATFYHVNNTKFQPVDRLISRLAGQYKRALFTCSDLRQG